MLSLGSILLFKFGLVKTKHQALSLDIVVLLCQGNKLRCDILYTLWFHFVQAIILDVTHAIHIVVLLWFHFVRAISLDVTHAIHIVVLLLFYFIRAIS